MYAMVRWVDATTLVAAKWPWPALPRIVIEDADRARAVAALAALRRAGYAVALCRGPSESRELTRRCPLAEGDECLLVEDADVVVCRLASLPEGRRALGALLDRRGDSRLVVELGPGEPERHGELEGCDVVAASASPEVLVEAVARALERETAVSPGHATRARRPSAAA